MKKSLDSNRNLTIVATDKEQRRLRSIIERNYVEGLKWAAGRVGLTFVDPADSGDLTSNYTILTDGVNDWWDQDYAVRSFADKIVQHGQVTLYYTRPHTTLEMTEFWYDLNKAAFGDLCGEEE